MNTILNEGTEEQSSYLAVPGLAARLGITARDAAGLETTVTARAFTCVTCGAAVPSGESFYEDEQGQHCMDCGMTIQDRT